MGDVPMAGGKPCGTQAGADNDLLLRMYKRDQHVLVSVMCSALQGQYDLVCSCSMEQSMLLTLLHNGALALVVAWCRKAPRAGDKAAKQSRQILRRTHPALGRG